jgi:hypothetical protein
MWMLLCQRSIRQAPAAAGSNQGPHVIGWLFCLTALAQQENVEEC